MDMTLRRMKSGKDGIFSELLKDDNSIFCQTLEHAYPNPDGSVFVPKIYNGLFICQKGRHKLDRGPFFETFEITGVAGHTGLLFHVGNFNSDSDGCVLLGLGSITGKGSLTMLTDSKDAFNAFMVLQGGSDRFHLTVIDYSLPQYQSLS